MTVTVEPRSRMKVVSYSSSYFSRVTFGDRDFSYGKTEFYERNDMNVEGWWLLMAFSRGIRTRHRVPIDPEH